MMIPFEALYHRKFHTPLSLEDKLILALDTLQ